MSDLVACIRAICHPDHSRNPLAWHRLHRAGLTVDLLRRASDRPVWKGQKPFFENAPQPDDPMWQQLEATANSRQEAVE